MADVQTRPSRREDVPVADQPGSDNKPEVTGLAPEPVNVSVVETDEERKLLESSSKGAVLSEADLNRRGLPSPRGTTRVPTTLRQVLRRERNAGLRRHRGEVVEV